MEKITNLENIKSNELYLINNKDRKLDSFNTRFEVVSKCIRTLEDEISFCDKFLIEGELVQDWTYTLRDFNQDRYNIFEISKDKYPEYYI